MKYTEILTSSAAAISDRSNKYGTPEECFGAIAQIATAMLGRKITEHDVAAIHVATKLGRHRMNKQYEDNLIDGCSYIGFLGHFADKANEESAPVPFGLPNSNVELLKTKGNGKAAIMGKSSYSVNLEDLADEIINPAE